MRVPLEFKPEDKENILCFTPAVNDISLLTWTPTLVCNYRCSYCIQNSKEKDKYKLRPLERYLATAKRINELVENSGRQFKLMLIGGEVTIIPTVHKIFERFTSENITEIQLTTNFSKDLEFYKKMLESVKRKIVLTISIHEEYVDVEEFVNKVKSLIDMKLDIVKDIKVEMVLTDKNEEHVNKAKELCLKLGIKLKIDIDRTCTKELIPEENKTKADERLVRVTYLDDTTKFFTMNSFRKNCVFDENTFFLCDTSRNITVDSFDNISGSQCTGLAKIVKRNIYDIRRTYLADTANKIILCKRMIRDADDTKGQRFNQCPCCKPTTVYVHSLKSE